MIINKVVKKQTNLDVLKLTISYEAWGNKKTKTQAEFFMFPRSQV